LIEHIFNKLYPWATFVAGIFVGRISKTQYHDGSPILRKQTLLTKPALYLPVSFAYIRHSILIALVLDMDMQFRIRV
jgi:hypothetical protein